MTQHIIFFLINHYYSFLFFILTGIAAAFILNAKDIIVFYKTIRIKTWLMLVLIITTGFIIRVWFIPQIHHVYYDEFEHLSIAENMYFHQKYSETLQGTYASPEEIRMETWPPAYHMILALSYNILGVSEKTAFNITAMIGTLSILLIFLFSYVLFKNSAVALYSAFILTFTPIHLKYCGSTSTDIASFTLILLSLLATALYIKYTKIKTLFLLITTAAFAVYARPENSILLLLLPFFIILLARKTDFLRKKIIIHALLGAFFLTILSSFYFLHVFYYGYFTIKDVGWVENIPTRLLLLWKNLPVNIFFWFGDRHPLVLTFLSIFGLLKLRNHKKKIAVFSIAWFLSFLFAYSFFKIGAFGSTGSAEKDRHALNLYISVILLSAYAIYALSNRWRRNKIIKTSVIFLLLLCISCGSLLPLTIAIGKSLKDLKHQQYIFILNNKSNIPDDIYVISYNPNIIISTIHKKAITPSLFLSLENKPKKIILFRDYWYYKKKEDSLTLDSFLIKNYKLKTTYGAENKKVYCSFMLFETEK